MSAAAEQETDQQQAKQANLAKFLTELTDLTHKYQIAISGQPVLICLERDDYALQYDSDSDGNLTGA